MIPYESPLDAVTDLIDMDDEGCRNDITNFLKALKARGPLTGKKHTGKTNPPGSFKLAVKWLKERNLINSGSGRGSRGYQLTKNGTELVAILVRSS